MPILAPGVYARPTDVKPENQEKISAYELKYYVDSALITIDFICNPGDSEIKRFKNQIQYYRFYSDFLFFTIGEICNRFVDEQLMPKDPDLCREKKGYLEANRRNYNFSANSYPNLSNKRARNIIEHLDERNLKTIFENSGAGGFNVLFEEGSLELRNNIMQHRNFYPFTLDIENNEFLFYDIQRRNQKQMPEFKISISELRDELINLRKQIENFQCFL